MNFLSAAREYEVPAAVLVGRSVFAIEAMTAALKVTSHTPVRCRLVHNRPPRLGPPPPPRLQTHLLSVSDLSPASFVLRRALQAVACCIRQAELRIIRSRVATCLPSGTLTDHGSAVATWGLDEEGN